MVICFYGYLQIVYFGANLLHMVKAIKQRAKINVHPCKEGLDFLILFDNIGGVGSNGGWDKANGFMVSNPIP